MHLKKRRIIPESLVIALFAGALTLVPGVEQLLPSTPTVLLVTSLFLAFWHGRLAGLLAFAVIQLVSIGGTFFLYHRIPEFDNLLINGTSGIVLCYLGGSLNQFRRYQIEKILTRYRKMADDKGKLSRISHSQQEIIRELEERVTRLHTSPNLLYQKIQEVDCLDTHQSITKLLDTIIHFTEATSLSLWVYDNRTNSLKLEMRRGIQTIESDQKNLDLKKSIEGWVFRNNQLFSIRMTMDYDALDALNTGSSIICCPVVLEDRIWGVINIEELPFIKYSTYTENLLQIIISLAQPALKRALDFESLLLEEEENPDTGLPHFTQLYRAMEKYKFNETGTLNSSSLIILEFGNHREMIEQYGLPEVRILQGTVLRTLAARSKSKPEMFHYREESEMALFIPSLDYDGCSLFSLESLEYINSHQWKIKGDIINLEIYLGYASSGTSEKMDPDDLIKRAEYLLEIQKI